MHTINASMAASLGLVGALTACTPNTMTPGSTDAQATTAGGPATVATSAPPGGGTTAAPGTTGVGTSSGGGTTGAPPPCSQSTAAPSSSVILIAESFAPSCITVKRNSSGTALVSFTNNDATNHYEVIAAGGQGLTLDSGDLAPGGFYNAKLTAPGTFTLSCKQQTSMTMTVIVQ